jgi:alkylation response protein AidB-like acyl-CoA dehydrogenase
MNLTFNEEERMHASTFREFMEKECSQEVVERAELVEEIYDRPIWKKMAELGWLGLGLGDEQDGDMVTICILCEEMGRALLPVPYIPTVVLGGRAVLEGGRETLRSEVIQAVEEGKCVISPALMEKDRFDGLASVECEARVKGDGYLLYGKKTYVDYAFVSDHLLLVARTGEGPTAFLVRPTRAGDLKYETLNTIGGRWLSHITLDGVRAELGQVLGEPGGARELLEPIIDRARTALAARMVGGSAAVVDKSVAYARERVQFGKPIGSFQAIAFKLADMATEVSGARLLVYKAAWLIDKGEAGAVKEAAMAKAFASELYQRAADVGVHVHGGYGFILEHDLQLYYRKAKADELSFGDSDYNRALVYGAG